MKIKLNTAPISQDKIIDTLYQALADMVQERSKAKIPELPHPVVQWVATYVQFFVDQVCSDQSERFSDFMKNLTCNSLIQKAKKNAIDISEKEKRINVLELKAASCLQIGVAHQSSQDRLLKIQADMKCLEQEITILVTLKDVVSFIPEVFEVLQDSIENFEQIYGKPLKQNMMNNPKHVLVSLSKIIVSIQRVHENEAAHAHQVQAAIEEILKFSGVTLETSKHLGTQQEQTIAEFIFKKLLDKNRIQIHESEPDEAVELSPAILHQFKFDKGPRSCSADLNIGAVKGHHRRTSSEGTVSYKDIFYDPATDDGQTIGKIAPLRQGSLKVNSCT